jgi:hypothetical protein
MTQPAPGMRVKKTTYTEVIPPEDRSPSDAQPSAFYADEWETVVQKLTQDQWQGHIMRVYRADEKWDRSSSPIDNTFTSSFTEEDLRKRFGGGRFLLWLYGPPKRQTLLAKYRATLDGDPIVNTIPRNGAQTANPSETVALEAMRMYANPEFVRMQMQMMVTAATEAMALIKSQMPVAQNPLETLRTAKEILGSGNSEHGLLDTIRVLKELGVVGSPEKKGIDEILSLITTLKTSGLIQSGAPKADLAATFANNLPMIVDRMVSGLHEFRLTSEANERAARGGRSEMRPSDPNVIDVQPSQPSSAQQSTQTAAAAPNAAAPSQPTAVSPETAQAIIAQSHLHRLVMGIKNPKSTGQDMYDYLRNAWPEILDELVKFNKDQLVAFFKSRDAQMQYFQCDVLTQVADDPRLEKLLDEFLKIAKDAAEAEKIAANGAAVV